MSRKDVIMDTSKVFNEIADAMEQAAATIGKYFHRSVDYANVTLQGVDYSVLDTRDHIVYFIHDDNGIRHADRDEFIEAITKAYAEAGATLEMIA